MDRDKLSRLQIKTMAAAIANQAILKCQLSKVELTTDHVILLIGDFFDPTDPDYAVIIPEIEKAITDVVEMPWLSQAHQNIR